MMLNKLNYKIFVQSILWMNIVLPNTVLAAPSFGNDFEDTDSDQVVEGDDSWNNSENADLSSSQGERRSESDYGILLDVGESTPWNSFGVRYQKWSTPDFAWSAYAGTGKSELKFPSQSLSLKSSSINVGGRAQWWPSILFPFSFAADLGLHKWKVSAECMGSVPVDTCSEGRVEALGLSVGSGILVSWFAEENIYVEWMILGIKRGQYLSHKTSEGLSLNVENRANKLIVATKPVGFANLSVGWRF